MAELQQSKGQECNNCGFRHPENRKSCPAQGRECHSWEKRNHFASRCHQEVKTVDDCKQDGEEVYQTDEVSTLRLDDSQLVTFNRIRGTQCNVLPLHIYKKASKDKKLEKVQTMQTSLVAYGGSKVKVIGGVPLHVWKNGSLFLPDCRLVDNDDIRPILGSNACIGMGILVYQDNHHLNKPETGNAPVYAMQTSDTVLSKDELLAKFPKVFKEGVGNLDSEYKIRFDFTVQPVRHAPRQIAVALRPKLKERLDHLGFFLYLEKLY